MEPRSAQVASASQGDRRIRAQRLLRQARISPLPGRETRSPRTDPVERDCGSIRSCGRHLGGSAPTVAGGCVGPSSWSAGGAGTASEAESLSRSLSAGRWLRWPGNLSGIEWPFRGQKGLHAIVEQMPAVRDLRWIRTTRATGSRTPRRGKSREDRTRTALRLSLHNRALSWRGFSPQVSLVHEVRRTNAQLYDYQRTGGELRFVRLF